MSSRSQSPPERPADEWEGYTPERLRARWGVAAVHLFRSVGSTNDVARRLAERGAPAGTVVLADEQLRGRGRSGRAWSSPAGLGVWLSVVLRPPPGTEPGLIPLAVGAAVAAALDPFAAPARLMLKWPNDLLIDGRKLAGVLCEGAWDAGGPGWVVAGIGANVLHGAEHLPPELRERATSFALVATRLPQREAIAGAIASAAARIGIIDARRLAREFGTRDALRGSEVVVLDAGSEPGAGAPRERGIALGIAPDGALLLRSAGGAVRVVRAGTVRPAAELADSGRTDHPNRGPA